MYVYSMPSYRFKVKGKGDRSEARAAELMRRLLAGSALLAAPAVTVIKERVWWAGVLTLLQYLHSFMSN